MLGLESKNKLYIATATAAEFQFKLIKKEPIPSKEGLKATANLECHDWRKNSMVRMLVN